MPKKQEKTEEKKQEGATAQEIAAELEAGEAEAVEEEGAAERPAAEQGQQFDLRSLTPEQRDRLMEVLNGVPATVKSSKKGNATVKLRQIDGKVVVDFGRAYQKVVMDLESRSERPRQHIQVRFHGEKDTVEMPYALFMAADRVKCEVLSQKREEKEKVIGETYHKEQKRMVEMTVKWAVITLTVKLPNGETTEVDSTKVN